MRTNTPPHHLQDPINALAEKTGLGLRQVEIGLALMRTGRADLITKVVKGEMTPAAALSAVRRTHSRED